MDAPQCIDPQSGVLLANYLRDPFPDALSAFSSARLQVIAVESHANEGNGSEEEQGHKFHDDSICR